MQLKPDMNAQYTTMLCNLLGVMVDESDIPKIPTHHFVEYKYLPLKHVIRVHSSIY